MTIAQAIILGIVQGLTEFLPISSSAHLRIIPALNGWEDPGAAFTAVVQIGTLAAILFYFRKEIFSIIEGVINGLLTRKPLHSPEARMGWMIAAGTLPIVFFGLLFKSEIETTLRSLYWVGSALIVLGIILGIAEARIASNTKKAIPARQLEEMGWIDALLIGLAQSLALIPGASRSGVTITGALFLNISRSAAARFSFLLSLPSVFAAAMLELYQTWGDIMASQQNLTALVTATLVAGIAGYATIAFLLGYLKEHTTIIFIIYRILAGTAILMMLGTGMLQP